MNILVKCRQNINMSKNISNKNKKEDNYLEFVPIPKKDLKYEISDGKVTIFQENKGIFNFLAQKLLNKPRISQIHLDDMGNFIWPLMNGKKDILAISKDVKDEFGEKAEPLYNRLVQYFKTLVSYGFVEFVSDSNDE